MDIQTLKNTKLLSFLSGCRKYMITAFIFWSFSVMLSAQSVQFPSTKTGSLDQTIMDSRGNKKVDALNQASEAVLKYSFRESLLFAQRALNLAQKLQYTNGKAKAYAQIASALSHKGETMQAMVMELKAIEIFRQIKERESLHYCLVSLASNYSNLGNNVEAIDTYLQALHLAEEMRRTDLQSTASANLSLFFMKIQDKATASVYASKAILLSEIARKPSTTGYAYEAMANFKSKYGQTGEAITYFHMALKNFLLNKQSFNIAGCYVQLGNHYLSMGDLNSAEGCFYKALKYNKAANDILPLSSVYNSIAHVYQLDKKLQKALDYQQKALKLRQDYGNARLIGSSLSNIGTVYKDMGNSPKALAYFTAGLKIATQLNRSDHMKFNYQHMYELYLSDKNYKKAFEYSLLLNALNDVILKKQASQTFADINYKHDVRQKIQSIELLSKENELQKLRLKQTSFATYVLVAVILLFLIIALLLGVQANLKTRHRQMDLEQKLLRSQMNPHFIFNALVAIQSFIYKKESAEAAKYLSSFARLIRLVLSNSSEEFVTLKCEIDTLSNYLSLQKLRFEDKFDYTILVDPDLDTERVNVPPMLAQPFVENAIEHGIFALNEPGRIVIMISKKEDYVLVEVNDNGVGREKGREIRKKTDKTHEPLATRITQERINSLNRKYSWRIHLKITDLFNDSDQAAGTSVLLRIPLIIME